MTIYQNKWRKLLSMGLFSFAVLFLLLLSGQPTAAAATTQLVLGDPNLDQTVTAADAHAVASHVLEAEVLTGDALLCADVNGDNVVNMLDAQLIYRHYTDGIQFPIPDLPTPEPAVMKAFAAADTSAWRAPAYKSNVVSVNFINQMTVPDGLASDMPWDVSESGDGSIKAWCTPSSLPEKYDLTIATNWGLANIGTSAFYDCTGISSIVVPDGVEQIGLSAFFGCSKLETVDLPESVTAIGGYGFYGCSALANMNLPAGLTTIGDTVLGGCENLDFDALPAGLTSIGARAFSNCGSLSLTVLPDSIQTIGKNAFFSCYALSLTKLPSALTSVGDSAFFLCSGISVSEFPSNLKEIGASAFSYCEGMSLSALPSGLVKIGNNAFESCTKLTISVLPEGIKNIEAYVFDGCSGISQITLPAGVETVGKYAFNGWGPSQIIKATGKTDASEFVSLGVNCFGGATVVYDEPEPEPAVMKDFS